MRRDDVPDELQTLAFNFFYWFSRFEFALKENRYLKSDKVGAPAEVSWSAFIRKHEGDYFLTKAGKDLVEADPQRQIVGAFELEFKSLVFSDRESDLAKVVRLSNTVRNNLFHGGKHGHDTWDDPARLRLLLSLVLLNLDELARHADIEADYRRYY